MTYLAQKYGESMGLVPPAASPERAAHNEWSFFTMMEINASAIYVLRRHNALTQVYGEAPNAVQAAREAFRTKSRSWIRSSLSWAVHFWCHIHRRGHPAHFLPPVGRRICASAARDTHQVQTTHNFASRAWAAVESTGNRRPPRTA